MPVKYTNHYLHKLEDIVSETDYILRYEKGNFKSGYCILNDSKIAIVNKFFALEGKINSLVEIIKEIDIDPACLSPANRKIYSELIQKEIQF